jgi:hypothetical protein
MIPRVKQAIIRMLYYLFCFVAQQRKPRLGRLVVRFIDHTKLDTHTLKVGIFWQGDQPFVRPLNTQHKNISALSLFRNRDPSKWVDQDVVLDRMATTISPLSKHTNLIGLKQNNALLKFKSTLKFVCTKCVAGKWIVYNHKTLLQKMK